MVTLTYRTYLPRRSECRANSKSTCQTWVTTCCSRYTQQERTSSTTTMRKRVFLFSLCCCCCCCKGFLDSSSHDTNLRVGSKLDLPFWLVKAIYNDKFKFAHIDLPKWYKNFYHEILKADPIVVDLRKMGPYYYEFGILLVRLLDPDQSQSIAKMLIWV